MLPSGIYEQVINRIIRSKLNSDENIVITDSIDKEEAAKILAQYFEEILETALENLKENGGDIFKQIELCNKLLEVIEAETKDNFMKNFIVDENAKLLIAYIRKKDNIHAVNDKISIIRPATSIARSSLFTGAIHEPSMFSELKKEILSCDRIYMLVSFIKWSGLRLIIDELTLFTKNGGQLRVITTSYMGATDAKAIEELSELPNTEIKVSYDTKRTRLHAKAYIFYRSTGFTTAYIGSSNLSNAAISSGLEWNVKITQKDLPETIQKIEATFENYWNSNEFAYYNPAEKSRLIAAIKAEKGGNKETISYNFDIQPYPYQQEILDKLQAERYVRNHWRNLVVAATGTGKTVISAIDYRNYVYKNRHKPCRLLFIAHREEILKQSLACFRMVLRDPNFGELFVGNYTPNSLDHLFMSVQTFNSREFENVTTPDFYDYIIVDEFHHAAAPTYQKLLEYYKPEILLGLTATPERMDGKDILKYFDYRIAAEIRLPEAIERKLLCPFHYFGVTDNVDLKSLRWTRGGYDKNELSKIYTGNDLRAKIIIKALDKYITDMDDVKGLGFCVSKEHAKYMANFFNENNIPSIYLTAESDDETRNEARRRLVRGDYRFIFVVDLYNEGVDIPEVNTILFLRPTESLTVFLQQLGRGLRLCEGKECLTVLDFIGQANRKYNFEEKFEALLSNTSKGIQREIKEDFISLPKGCFIQLEKIAKEYILMNIKHSLRTQNGLISKIASFEEDTNKALTLTNFVEHYHIKLKSIYAMNNFSRLCVLAKVKEDFTSENEDIITKGMLRLSSIDSRRWISFLIDILPEIDEISIDMLNTKEKKMLNMLHHTFRQQPVKRCGFDNVIESIRSIKKNEVLFKEIMELLEIRFNSIDLVDEQIDLGYECPLDLYCNYTRDQILSAFDYYTEDIMPPMREGVLYLSDKNTDLLFVTLNKSEKDYSPTTMYNDYSISEYLFHWQSQSTTSETSTTGQRYINHKKLGNKVLLFVREFREERIGSIIMAQPYTFLGLVDYVSHKGSRPMNIIWKLEKPIPAKYLKKTNKLIVG
ncbi:MAG TPA: DUF3427 domain-containing protein [Clostridiaceae bacterium]|nr:DUF3427 domain-containing protein [Clostridiaceae bacterium]